VVHEEDGESEEFIEGSREIAKQEAEKEAEKEAEELKQKEEKEIELWGNDKTTVKKHIETLRVVCEGLDSIWDQNASGDSSAWRRGQHPLFKHIDDVNPPSSVYISPNNFSFDQFTDQVAGWIKGKYQLPFLVVQFD
jgi:hypothetical protein